MTVYHWAAVFCGVVTLVNLVSLGIGAWRIGRRPRRSGALDPATPVSIVRPVRGLETFSDETLRSGFTLEHADYELIFCTDTSADPIIPLLKTLMDAHPDVPARLLVGDDRISANPKLNNCVKGWEAARHDWVILADSNIVMPPNYVARLMGSWRDDTGLVSSTPVGSRPDGFWATVECAFLNTLQARWQYVGEGVGLGFAQGKSMLWHKPFLESHGGIRALAAEIAEDAASTKLVRRAGRHVHLVDKPFEQPLGRRGAREIWDRQIRWARLRRVTFPLFFAPELVSSGAIPIFLGLVAAAGLGLGAPAVLAVAAGLLVAWYGPEMALAAHAGWHRSWRLPLACIVRDLMILPMWMSAWVTQDIEWRGNVMTIRSKGSEMGPADSTAV